MSFKVIKANGIMSAEAGVTAVTLSRYCLDNEKKIQNLREGEEGGKQYNKWERG
jgi:hypothetical protein